MTMQYIEEDGVKKSSVYRDLVALVKRSRGLCELSQDIDIDIVQHSRTP